MFIGSNLKHVKMALRKAYLFQFMSPRHIFLSNIKFCLLFSNWIITCSNMVSTTFRVSLSLIV